MKTSTRRSLPITARVTARQIAEYLKACGYKIVGKVTEPDEDVDGEIDLGRGVHVQVGFGYAEVGRWDEVEAVAYHGEARYDAKDLLPDIDAWLAKVGLTPKAS